MRFLTFSALLAITGVGVFSAPQNEPIGAPGPKAGGQSGGKSPGGGGGGGSSGNSGPTGLGAILGSEARPGTGCAKLEVLIG
jgi:hypothetical protein